MFVTTLRAIALFIPQSNIIHSNCREEPCLPVNTQADMAAPECTLERRQMGKYSTNTVHIYGNINKTTRMELFSLGHDEVIRAVEGVQREGFR